LQVKGHSAILLSTSLILVFLASSRVTGCYFYMFFSYLLFLLCFIRSSPNLSLRRLDMSFLLPLAYLILYQFFVFLGDAVRIGFSFSLRASILMFLNLPLGFALGALAFSRGTTFPRLQIFRFSFSVSFLFVFFASMGSLLSALHSAWLLRSSGGLSIVALRPSETLYAVGLFLIALMIAHSGDQVLSIAPLKRPVVLIIAILSLVLIPISFYVFRGIASSLAAAAVCCPLAYISCRSLSVFRRTSFLGLSVYATSAVIMVHAVSVFFSFKEFIFRYLVFPFFASNTLNGRLALYEQALPFLASSHLVGEASGLHSFQGQWTHLFFLDTILRHGYVSYFFVQAFLFQLLILLVLCKASPFIRINCAVVFISLFVGSLVQPVEFSDGIAFQLSFLVLGLLYALISPVGYSHLNTETTNT